MDWLKEMLLGLVLLAIGGFLTLKFFKAFLQVLLGLLGPILLVLGIILFWIGIEDKRMEKELKNIEKELEEEKSK